MLWEVDIHPAPGQPDRTAARVAAAAAELHLAPALLVASAHGFLLQGSLTPAQLDLALRELLVDRVVEVARTGLPSDPDLCAAPASVDGSRDWQVVHVLLKPGVMDPVALTAQQGLTELGLDAEAVRTFHKYWLSNVPAGALPKLCQKLLANDAIEQVVLGPLAFSKIELGSEYRFQLQHVALRALSDDELMQLSKKGQLYLSLPEMQRIQSYYRELDREPTDIELETLAQTWSEHCSHKTLAGRIRYRDERGVIEFQNMLKETIFAATQQIRAELGENDWCVSVFRDNAGVVKFDDQIHVVFKVETHNHPSALEPYGGANTGLGGVIRDPLGTGLGAKPICSTDVFCFAPPDTPPESLPPGVLHPKRVLQGVVSGVRDYGNRMGIPTVNGAVYFDPRYLGNPLVYCGNVGILPCDKAFKQPQPGDYIVAVGGRTGRDGIHGATFSSAELTEESETVSGGAVQIGNAITEKMVLDVLLAARDRNLFHAITDCGAGGFSSAVGEMGEEIGAEVWLDKIPLKYAGLSYTEMWISEAQERMILAVGPDQWDELAKLCASENVEATILGIYHPTGQLLLKYQDQIVGQLSMEFLHGGRPPVVREATYQPLSEVPFVSPTATDAALDFNAELLKLLGSYNIASKEWVIRQYDHEVQGGSVIKPLVGRTEDGPSDAAVVRPRLNSRRGLVVSCGFNPRLGDLDPARMAASALDEAVRNCVSVGADPARIALLDNFCWGNTDRPETLGSLVRAALMCRDLAVAWKMPFISGKDSLNNEFRYTDPEGRSQVLVIPPSLLISALGQVPDVAKCVTMDLKQPGNYLYQLGKTYPEMGGSQYAFLNGLNGGTAPTVRPDVALRTFQHLHHAIQAGLVRACHDLSEGGLAVAVAEMAFAGGYGAVVDLAAAGPQLVAGEFPAAPAARAELLLFSESNSRFVCEVRSTDAVAFEAQMSGIPCQRIGAVVAASVLLISQGEKLIELPLDKLRETWQAPLRF